MSDKKHKALIVGGGFGGIKTALELSKDKRFEITLVTDEPDFRYYPSLYRTATGGSREVSSIPLVEIFAEYPNIKVVLARAEKLDQKAKILTTNSDEKFEYDVLVLALGMVTNFFNIPGIKEFAYGIKTVDNAEELKRHIHKHIVDHKHPDLNYVVVGGGPTGVELAGVLGDYVDLVCQRHGVGKRSVHVDLVESSPRVVSMMPKSVSRTIARQLRRKGVKLYLNNVVKSQNNEELLVNDKPIRSHTVIWTAGTSNNSFYTDQGFQLAANHKVRVDHFLQAQPGIYVIGDNADTPYSGLAQTALYDGVYVANNLIRLANNEKPLPYIAKRPIYVLPAGKNWAAVVWGRIHLYGRLGWFMRRTADFIGYHDYEPWFRATRHWIAEYKTEELCPDCEKS